MKRWVLTTLFAVALCAGAVSAQAAVTSGGTEYVWYTDMGRGEYNENDQFVSYEGPRLYISADQGGSYAELPGLRETQRRTGLSYVLTVEANAADDGGLSVKGRDIWSAEYTWFRDYSAQEIAAALKNPTVVTPIHVFATNGTVTVGSRYVEDYGNDDPTQPGSTGGNLLTGTYAGERIVYSTDGVTWLPAEEGNRDWWYLDSIWWDGEAFQTSYGGFSADGIHWNWPQIEREWIEDPTFALSCELGPYRFEYAKNTDGEWGVYLMDRTSPDTGVLLPHMGQAARDKWMSIGKLRAWYGPNDTVILAAYDVWAKERHMVSINYPISSLDWCLENLKTQFRTIEPVVSDGNMSLGEISWDFRIGRYYGSESRLACNDGNGWKWAENVPWGNEATPLFCTGGYFWVKGAGHHLYRSADGQNWLLSDALRPADQGTGSYSYLRYKIAATDSGFVASRHGGEGRYGMFGSSGGGWCEGYSKAYILDKNFELVSDHDFGRRVYTVGWYNGAYYAQVANSDGHRDGMSINDPGVFNEAEGAAIYRSTDGKTWERLPDIYNTDLSEDLVGECGGWASGPFFHGTEEKPIRSVAQLDRWRFVLDEFYAWDYATNIRDEQPTYQVCLMGDFASDWVELPHLGEAIQAQGIQAREVLAAYNPDGTVEVKVTDKNDPARYIAISYPTSSLDWVKENLMVVGGRDLPAYLGTNNDAWDIASKYGVADLTVVELANGERELVYRSPDTGGRWKWYDSTPWGNDPRLLSFSGKDFMVHGNGGVFLSSDGVNWQKAESEWLKERLGWNTFCYGFAWTGERYLVGFDPYGGYGKGANWEQEDMGKVFFLDEELNLLSVCDMSQQGEPPVKYIKRNVSRVGVVDGLYYALLSDEYYIQEENRGVSGRDEPVLYRSINGMDWEKTGVVQVQESLVGLQ